MNYQIEEILAFFALYCVHHIENPTQIPDLFFENYINCFR